MNNNNKDKRGAALLIVMMVFAIAAIIAFSVISRQQIDIVRTSNILDQAQAIQYALGAEALARQVLIDDALLTPGIDYLGQHWASLHDGLAIEQGEVTIQIEDLQGKLNLNSMLDGNGVMISGMNRLLKALEIQSDAATIIPSLAAKATSEKNGVAFIDNITALHTTDLLNDDYNHLLPFITAIPVQFPQLNINTASDTLLRAMIPDDKEYTSLMNLRSIKGFVTADQLHNAGAKMGLVTKSEYFSINVRVTYNRRVVKLTSVLHRGVNVAGALNTSIISRDLSNF